MARSRPTPRCIRPRPCPRNPRWPRAMPLDSKPGASCATSADCASPAKRKTERRVAGMEQVAAAPPEPNHGFDNSRRLTGTNRYFADPAVTLTPLGSSAGNSTALNAWAARVRALCAALGWPDPQPRIEKRAAGTLLVFRAPPDSLLTATEVSEWAWERAAAEQGESAFDLAHDLGDDPGAVAAFAARSAAERVAALEALRAAAARHRVPLFEDDAEVSLGAGSGSRRWPRDALPAVDAVPWSELHDVPTAVVTGSNGKTTTVRLLAAMAAAAG